MAVSPITKSSDLASFSIRSNGSYIQDKILIGSIEITMKANAMDEAILKVFDGNPEKDAIDLTNEKTFELGREIEIALGYDNNNKRVFRGIVTQQQLSINSGEVPVFQVTCKNIINGQEQILKQNIDVIKPSPILKVTYGYDLLEAQLINDPSLDVYGHLKFPGSSLANVNDTIAIYGIGSFDHFGANKSIHEVTHKLEEGFWTTTVIVI